MRLLTQTAPKMPATITHAQKNVATADRNGGGATSDQTSLAARKPL